MFNYTIIEGNLISDPIVETINFEKICKYKLRCFNGDFKIFNLTSTGITGGMVSVLKKGARLIVSIDKKSNLTKEITKLN